MSDKKSQDKADRAQPIDTVLVRELAGILRDTGLSEIEFEQGEMRLRLARTMTAAPLAQAPAPAAHAHYEPAAAAAAPTPEPARNGAAHPGAVMSPMVGTAFLSPEPGAPPFVKIGDSVTEGQTLMVVEAMKTFNPIPAPRAGKVLEILVGDAQPVEFGEALVVLE